MAASEKIGYQKKNQYIHLATFTASLALGFPSDVSSEEGYVSPTATFLSAEHCAFPVDCDLRKEFVGPGQNGRNGE